MSLERTSSPTLSGRPSLAAQMPRQGGVAMRADSRHRLSPRDLARVADVVIGPAGVRPSKILAKCRRLGPGCAQGRGVSFCRVAILLATR